MGSSSGDLIVHIRTAEVEVEGEGEGKGSDQVGIVHNTGSGAGGQVNLIFCDDAVSYDPLSPFQVLQ